MAIVFNNGNGNDIENGFISNSFIINKPVISNDKFAEYPLSLIPDLDSYVNIELLFISLLINSMLANYISKLKFQPENYIKNQNILKIIKFLIDRYIKI